MTDACGNPDLVKFIVEDPLYADTLRFRMTVAPLGTRSSRLPDTLMPLSSLLQPRFAVDTYCIWCKQPSIFNAEEIEEQTLARYIASLYVGGVFYRVVTFRCSREHAHDLGIVLRILTLNYGSVLPAHEQTASVMKVGMFPSLADLQQPLDKRSAKALGEKGAAEFKRAVGLAAHGIGIGAFVYLRRIFEDLVDEVAGAALTAGEVSQQAYERSRMDDKIVLLKARLPPFLVEHKQWYGIVSKGIHELDERNCFSYFAVVRAGIEIMLAQKADALDRMEREREAGLAISTLGEKLANDGRPPVG